jgi:hypothetical protein
MSRYASMGDSDELVAREDSSEYRIKMFKELSRMSGAKRDAEGVLAEQRIRRQLELAATRHPRWRGAGSGA